MALLPRPAVVRAVGRYFAAGPGVGIDGPVVQRTDPRRFVREGLEGFGVIEGENFAPGHAVQARAEADLDGRVNLLDLPASLVGGGDGQFRFGFAFVDKSLSELHDHDVGGVDFDPFGFGVGQQRPRGLRKAIRDRPAG